MVNVKNVKVETVPVPGSLLLAGDVLPTAQVTWMAVRCDERRKTPLLLSRTRLAARTCLSQPTVRKALRGLGGAGWITNGRAKTLSYRPAPASAASEEGTRSAPAPRLAVPARRVRKARRALASIEVRVPASLLADESVGPRGKVLYGVLQALARGSRRGEFRHSQLSRVLGVIFLVHQTGSAIGSSLAGVIFAFYYNNLFPEQIFHISRSIELILGPIIGGIGTLVGPLVGALVITGLAEGMREVMLQLGIDVPGVKQVFYGVCLLAVVIFLPDGVWPPLARKLGLGRRS